MKGGVFLGLAKKTPSMLKKGGLILLKNLYLTKMAPPKADPVGRGYFCQNSPSYLK